MRVMLFNSSFAWSLGMQGGGCVPLDIDNGSATTRSSRTFLKLNQDGTFGGQCGCLFEV
jgi:hypothetical protein